MKKERIKKIKVNYGERRYSPRRRYVAVFVIFTLIFTAVFGKLAYVMLAQSEMLTSRALSQWLRDVPLEAPRGKILDRNGIVLADTSTLYTIYVRPNAVTDRAGVAKVLSDVLELDYEQTLQKVSKRSSEVTIAHGVTKEQMTKIYSSGKQGIYYAEDNYRYYPFGNFMTQLLGFTSFDGDGQTGLEAYYNKYLKGVNGAILAETDLIGRPINSGQTYYAPSIGGMNLVTTLDYYIQRIAEAAVNKAMETYKAKNAACVIMDYNTGEIVALAEAPAFDLNNVPRDDIDTLFARSKSMIVSNVYEPGSTFKILTAAAALNEGLFNEHSRFYCPGSRVVDGKKIRCWRTQGHGSISYAEGVERSCNCVFMDSALALGVDRFYDYMRAFGLHEKTGIDMKGETSGIFIAQESVKNVDLARIGFGQAVAVSPIELITATSAVVNGGVTVRPHIAKSAVDTVSGKVIQIAKPFEGKRVISESTSKLMNEMLKSVVTLGSGKLAHVPGYEIIGKTGTAQKYAGGTIAQGKYVSSFLGFSLTEGANYAVLFIVDEPQGYLYYGSLVAAPFVGEIYQQIFSYLNIQPKYTGEEAELYGTPFTLGDYTGMSVNEAMNAAKKLGLYVEIDGEGDVVKEQFPHAGAVVTKRNTILFVT